MRSFAALVLALAAASSAGAQRTWPVPGDAPFLAFELGKGIFREFPVTGGSGTVNPMSYTVTASGRTPISRSLALTWEVPFSRVSATLTLQSGSSTETGYAFGNPWVGIERMGQGGLTFEAGIRPGLLKPGRDVIGAAVLNNGVVADYDHYEAWEAGYSSARAAFRYDRQLRGAFFMTGIGGASIAVTTGEESEEEGEEEEGSGPDFYVMYGLRAGVRTAAVTVDAAFLGRYYPTASGPNAEPTVNQLAFEFAGNRGVIQPAASIRFYFDRLLRPRTRATLSVGLTIFY